MPQPKNELPKRRRFGKWTVQAIDLDNPGRRVRWICRCKCGTTKSVNAQTLTRGTSTGCYFCAKKGRPCSLKFQSGDTVGKWTVIEYDTKSHCYLCRCKCGTTGLRRTGNLVASLKKVGDDAGCRVCMTAPALKKILAEKGDFSLDATGYNISPDSCCC